MAARRSLLAFKTILYILAGLLLGLGLIVGLSLIAGSANIQNVLLPFHLMGSEVIANLIAPYLKGLVSGMGVVILIISSVLSLLLFAAGHLLSYIAALEARLAALEAHIQPM